MILITGTSCTEFVDARTIPELEVLSKHTLDQLGQCHINGVLDDVAAKNIGEMQRDVFRMNNRPRGGRIEAMNPKDYLRAIF